MNKYKIGITCKDSSKIWTNGLTQNTYFLIELLSELGYLVSPVSQFDEAGLYIEEYLIKKLSSETIRDYDILIECCYSLTDDLLDETKNSGTKVVTINYGNTLLLVQEDLVLNPKQLPAINRGGHDTWISPHFEFSKGFIEATSKGTVNIAPYIWSSKIFDKYCKANNLNPFYDGGSHINKVGVFEPNINMIKTCIYSLLSLEKLERTKDSNVKDILVFNGMSLKDNLKFKEIIKNFDIFTNGKLSMEDRYPLANILSKKYIGTILSHQFYCDLNYLVLEGLYTGHPIIHNSEFCKDAGYFYETFDAANCADQIKMAIETHNDNINRKSIASKDVLFRFSLENIKNINGYKYLIENIS